MRPPTLDDYGTVGRKMDGSGDSGGEKEKQGGRGGVGKEQADTLGSLKRAEDGFDEDAEQMKSGATVFKVNNNNNTFDIAFTKFKTNSDPLVI